MYVNTVDNQNRLLYRIHRLFFCQKFSIFVFFFVFLEYTGYSEKLIKKNLKSNKD